MRVDHFGCYRRVSVSAKELDEFAAKWPGSGLAGRRGFSIEFDSNRDLTGGSVTRLDGKPGVDSTAINAIIDDAKRLAFPGD